MSDEARDLSDEARDLGGLLRDLEFGDRDTKASAAIAAGTVAEGHLDEVRPHLVRLIETSDPGLQILAASALAELGDGSDLVVETLARYLDPKREMPSIESVQEYTLMQAALEALSHVKGNPRVVELLVHFVQYGGASFEANPQVSDSTAQAIREKAIFALGALGDEGARQQLEYLVDQGGSEHQRAAQAALELFGEADYEQIGSRAEELKEKKEEKASSGCLVAGAIYGETSTEVALLRHWRDSHLRYHSLGRMIIMVYRVVSPTLATAARASSVIRFLLQAVVVVPAVKLAERRTRSR